MDEESGFRRKGIAPPVCLCWKISCIKRYVVDLTGESVIM